MNKYIKRKKILYLTLLTISMSLSGLINSKETTSSNIAELGESIVRTYHYLNTITGEKELHVIPIVDENYEFLSSSIVEIKGELPVEESDIDEMLEKQDGVSVYRYRNTKTNEIEKYTTMKDDKHYKFLQIEYRMKTR